MDNILAPFIQNIRQKLGVKGITHMDKMQSLWSDYGAVYRLRLKDSDVHSAVVKCIVFQKKSDHPRGWASSLSHERKLKSYLIENHWYEEYVASLPASVKLAKLLYSEHTNTAQVLVLEDLSNEYPDLKQHCTFNEAQTVVKWLAQFHGHFMNMSPDGLWPTGSYWHLATRPEEWEAMKGGLLKEKAKELDQVLSHAKFQTIIHGDAKVANFCFGEEGKVAAVDFQYVGGGIGVKDLAYFLGSCFTDDECELYENALLDVYFNELQHSAKGLSDIEKTELEKEWRTLYCVAWADFNRFLMGWLPGHPKLHNHALAKNKEALNFLGTL